MRSSSGSAVTRHRGPSLEATTLYLELSGGETGDPHAVLVLALEVEAEPADRGPRWGHRRAAGRVPAALRRAGTDFGAGRRDHAAAAGRPPDLLRDRGADLASECGSHDRGVARGRPASCTGRALAAGRGRQNEARPRRSTRRWRRSPRSGLAVARALAVRLGRAGGMGQSAVRPRWCSSCRRSPSPCIAAAFSSRRDEAPGGRRLLRSWRSSPCPSVALVRCRAAASPGSSS